MQGRNPIQDNALIVGIATAGSFKNAAKILHTTPPSLTRRLSSLERDIGVRLFERSTRRLGLTLAGSVFVQEAVLSLSHADRAWELARAQAQMESGPYRIGYTPYTHSSILPLLHHVGPVKQPPNDEPSGVMLESADTPELVERVLQGNLQAALCVGPVADENLWVYRIGVDAFTVCLPRNHRMAQKTGVSAHDLDRETVYWMPRSEQPNFYDKVTQYIGSLGAHPIFREVKSPTHAFEYASRSFGLALLPQFAVAHLTYSGVVFKPLTDRYLGLEMVLLMRTDQRHGKLKEIVDSLLMQLRTLRLGVN